MTQNNIDDITYHRMHNFNKARDCRTYRVKKRIQNYVLTGKAIFLTLCKEIFTIINNYIIFLDKILPKN